MRTPILWTLILIPVALGCSKPRVTYEVDPSFQAGSYRSIAADPRKDRIIIREGMRPLNPELHLKAALAELEARRYQPAAIQDADLWVSAYILIGGSPGSPHREGAGEAHRGGGKGGSRAGGAPAASPARGGLTLIIQLVERKTGSPVWQGEAKLDPTDKAADGSPLSIEESVHQLLQPLAVRP